VPKKITTTTPDPELSPPLASGNEVNVPHRHDPPQAQQPQQPGSGGAPGTGEEDAEPNPSDGK
jgi:hypothetical protein